MGRFANRDRLADLLKRLEIAAPRSGADIGLGWMELVEKLLSNMIALGWDRKLDQIKEKFGGLRIYVGACEEPVHLLISAAETASFRTCEACGAPGELRQSRSWHKTLCDLCDAEPEILELFR